MARMLLSHNTNLRMRTSFENWLAREMAEQGSLDDLLSTEVDEKERTALVGSLESQLSSATGKETLKAVSNATFNNNHIGGNATGATVVQNLPRSQHHTLPVPVVTGMNNTHKVISQVTNNINSVKGTQNNPQIIGISSIISGSPNNNHVLNRNSSPASAATNTGSSNVSLQNNKHITNPTSIRIVTSSLKHPNSSTGQNQTQNTHFVTNNNSAMSGQSVTIRSQPAQGHSLGGLNRVNISGASTAIHNLATIAAEAKPLSLPNGSSHIQTLQHKDGSVISPQIVVKNDGMLKRDGTTPVIQNIRQSTPIISSGSQIRVTGTSNPNVMVRNTNTPQSQHVIVRATVATTMANSSPSVQVVNASSAGTPSTLRPSINPQMRPGVRISNPSSMRIATPQNIAPRQPSSQSVSIFLK